MNPLEDSKLGYFLGFLAAAILLCAAAERLIATGLMPGINCETRPSVLLAKQGR